MRKNKAAFTIICLLLLLLGGYLIYKGVSYQRNLAQCRTLHQRLGDLLAQKNYKAANTLMEQLDGCHFNDLPTSQATINYGLRSETKVEQVIAQADNSIELYKKGNANDAKVKAAEVIALAQSIPPQDKARFSPQKVVALNNILEDMYAIQDDRYNPNIRHQEPPQS